MKAEHELVPPSDNSSFAVREFRLPRFASPWHLHSEYELTLILKGSGKRFVGDNAGSFCGGDLVLIGSGLPHFWCSDRDSKKSHSIVIQFTENCLGEGFFDHPELRQVKGLLARARRGIRFTGKAAAQVAGKLRAIRHATGTARLQAFLFILDLLAKTRQCRPLAGEGFIRAPMAWQDERIRRARQYITDHIAEDISLKEVASRAGMSAEAFCRLFKRTTRQTLFSFINQLRISRACAMLIESDISVSEACFAAGFNNLSNFNRRFLQYKGTSPRQFRRQFRA